jgi:hypothetical protein
MAQDGTTIEDLGRSTAAERLLGSDGPMIEQPRRSLLTGSRAAGLTPAQQTIDRSARPGWLTAAEMTPRVGDSAYCTAGPGAVIRILGKTGDGSRLIELKLDSGVRDTFFVAGSNVLLAPRPSET